MGMISVNVLVEKNYDINNKSGKKVFCNFYSGLFTYNFDKYIKEYQKHFMYRILDQIKIFSS